MKLELEIPSDDPSMPTFKKDKIMKLKRIADILEFQAVGEPLKNIKTEIIQIERRLEEIHIEYSRQSGEAGSKSAWSSFLNATPDAMARRHELRGEAQKLEARKQLLSEAVDEGQQQVDAMIGKLSRQPCVEARALSVVWIKKILAALDEINEANRQLSAI